MRSEFVVDEFCCRDIFDCDPDGLEDDWPVVAVEAGAVQQLSDFGGHFRMRENNVSRLS
jgi:hypothetical protein